MTGKRLIFIKAINPNKSSLKYHLLFTDDMINSDIIKSELQIKNRLMEA